MAPVSFLPISYDIKFRVNIHSNQSDNDLICQYMSKLQINAAYLASNKLKNNFRLWCIYYLKWISHSMIGVLNVNYALVPSVLCPRHLTYNTQINPISSGFIPVSFFIIEMRCTLIWYLNAMCRFSWSRLNHTQRMQINILIRT